MVARFSLASRRGRREREKRPRHREGSSLRLPLVRFTWRYAGCIDWLSEAECLERQWGSTNRSTRDDREAAADGRLSPAPVLFRRWRSRYVTNPGL